MKLLSIHISKRFGWVEATLVNDVGRVLYKGNIKEIVKLAERRGWKVEGMGDPERPQAVEG